MKLPAVVAQALMPLCGRDCELAAREQSFYNGPILDGAGNQCQTDLDLSAAMLATRKFWFQPPVKYSFGGHTLQDKKASEQVSCPPAQTLKDRINLCHCQFHQCHVLSTISANTNDKSFQQHPKIRLNRIEKLK